MVVFKQVFSISIIAFVLSMVQIAAPALASSAIRDERGEPYNKPKRLARPQMVCIIGEGPSQTICSASVAPPLTECGCRAASNVGLRYFIYQRQQKSTVFTFDGYNEVYKIFRHALSDEIF